MAHPERPVKISKHLRLKAHEFLHDRKNSESLVEIVRHFDSGEDLCVCLLALELVFTNLLRERNLYVDVVPLKPAEKTAENAYKQFLRNIYDDCFAKIVGCMDHDAGKIQIQGLATAMNILSQEGMFPLENKNHFESYVPLNRLKAVLMKLLSNSRNHCHLINKYTEYLLCNDVLFFTWKLLPALTAKSNPGEYYIINYLVLLEKLQLYPHSEPSYLCGNDGSFFTFDESITKKCLNKIWNCVMQWEHTPASHKQLLIVLLERVLPHLEKPLLLTDFLMDSLDVGGPVSLLALQGIFTMIQGHNLNYPNIFTKLYSMFEPEIFHTKYKARLFYLSDLFLSSTHLPEMLVAAFAKRLARLALVAPSEDIVIICMFIGNLILRHPGLKYLLNHPSGGMASASDPYIMDERDPLKSNAISSSLWEIQTLQQHVVPNVATAARFINSPLPCVEWDLSKVLDETGDDLFDRELKKYSKLFVLAFDKPNGGGGGGGGSIGSLIKGDRLLQYWDCC